MNSEKLDRLLAASRNGWHIGLYELVSEISTKQYIFPPGAPLVVKVVPFETVRDKALLWAKMYAGRKLEYSGLRAEQTALVVAYCVPAERGVYCRDAVAIWRVEQPSTRYVTWDWLVADVDSGHAMCTYASALHEYLSVENVLPPYPMAGYVRSVGGVLVYDAMLVAPPSGAVGRALLYLTLSGSTMYLLPARITVAENGTAVPAEDAHIPLTHVSPCIPTFTTRTYVQHESDDNNIENEKEGDDEGVADGGADTGDEG